ncbi:MAG: methyltransferase domain-containing protein [Pseudomonadaceae bacterium]|nr:methyltransferase domain-containing protein [Pseudomonadaceae bacterium]
MKCPICESTKLISLYKVSDLPLFQNKVYNSPEEAIKQKEVDISLCQCNECGFVFNELFNNEEMDYDVNYQNEQNYSSYFVEHLNSVADYLIENGFQEKNVIEIGCGKGYFTELLEEKGFKNIYGFDPAYEGENPNIIKDYFGEKYKSLNADLIILRHVLEHIENPYLFLKQVQRSTSGCAKILIEVPSFEWIVENKAFWDIFHEHCNYFDKEFMSSFFSNAETKDVFNSQYFLTLASLNEIKKPSSNKKYSENLFAISLNKFNNFLINHLPLAIWGGSSKGVTLLNIFDKDKKIIDCCIDINPKKQNKFTATTGHEVISPERFFSNYSNTSASKYNIIVANQNYFSEIVNQYGGSGVNFHSLEKLLIG